MDIKEAIKLIQTGWPTKSSRAAKVILQALEAAEAYIHIMDLKVVTDGDAYMEVVNESKALAAELELMGNALLDRTSNPAFVSCHICKASEWAHREKSIGVKHYDSCLLAAPTGQRGQEILTENERLRKWISIQPCLNSPNPFDRNYTAMGIKGCGTCWPCKLAHSAKAHAAAPEPDQAVLSQAVVDKRLAADSRFFSSEPEGDEATCPKHPDVVLQFRKMLGVEQMLPWYCHVCGAEGNTLPEENDGLSQKDVDTMVGAAAQLNTERAEYTCNICGKTAHWDDGPFRWAGPIDSIYPVCLNGCQKPTQ